MHRPKSRRPWAALALAGAVALGATGVRLARAADLTPSLALFEQVYQDLMTQYVTPLNPATLIRGAIRGMISTLNDPYTEYMDAQEYRAFADQLNGQVAGIGVVVFAQDGYVTVQSVITGSPAARAGLRAGDRIVAVDGQSIVGASLEKASALIRGQPGTRVRLTLERAGQRLQVTITRALVTVPAVTYKMLPGGIAYIDFTQVTPQSAKEMASALAKVQAHRPRGLILDLRDNPGGLVQAVVEIAQDFVPKGTIVSFQDRTGGTQTFTSRSGKRLPEPVVVLVNRGTASAAEVLTAALKDNGLAKVVGTRTFGKGVAQAILNLQDGGVLKLTVARWLTPKGQNINGVGIQPDLYAAGDLPPLLLAEHLLGLRGEDVAVLPLNGRGATLDGQSLPPPGIDPPVVRGGRVYLDATTVENLLGPDVTWDAASSTIIVRYGQDVLTLPANSPTGMLGGRRPVPLRTPARVFGGVPYVPLGDLAQVFGYRIQARPGELVIRL